MHTSTELNKKAESELEGTRHTIQYDYLSDINEIISEVSVYKSVLQAQMLTKLSHLDHIRRWLH